MNDLCVHFCATSNSTVMSFVKLSMIFVLYNKYLSSRIQISPQSDHRINFAFLVTLSLGWLRRLTTKRQIPSSSGTGGGEDPVVVAVVPSFRLSGMLRRLEIPNGSSDLPWENGRVWWRQLNYHHRMYCIVYRYRYTTVYGQTSITIKIPWNKSSIKSDLRLSEQNLWGRKDLPWIDTCRPIRWVWQVSESGKLMYLCDREKLIMMLDFVAPSSLLLGELADGSAFLVRSYMDDCQPSGRRCSAFFSCVVNSIAIGPWSFSWWYSLLVDSL